MRTGVSRRITALAVAAALAIGAARGAFAQTLPEEAAKAGFREAAGKSVGAFSARSLSGSTLDSRALAAEPALFVVWSPLADLSGQAAKLAKAASEFGPVVLVSVDGEKPARDAAASNGLNLSMVSAEAQKIARALGSPSAPAWIFAAPGGSIAAFKLGPLDPASGLSALRSLFAAAKPAGAASGASGPAAGTATGPSEPAAKLAEAPQATAGAPTPAAPGAAGSSPQATAGAADPAALPELNKGVADASFASRLELDVVLELNLARTRPGEYAAILREYRKSIRGNYLERPGKITIVLNEGAKAVDEAIAFLERQKPLPPLSLSKGLSLAARDHARDQGKTGQTGHSGSDRSSMDGRIKRYGSWLKTAGENIAYGPETAREIVIQLIVDDGVPSRGHRANVYNAAFGVVGVAFGTHPKYGTVCVQDFAGGYEEK